MTLQELKAIFESVEWIDYIGSRGFSVKTQLLTPHNDSIQILVREVEDGLFTVSDMGEAAREISILGIDPIPIIEPIVKDRGLIFQSGAIILSSLLKINILSSVILVANASKEAMFAALPKQK